jgi:hypothetical protein
VVDNGCSYFERIEGVKLTNTEIQYVKKRIKQLEADMANLVMALIELKVFKIKIDENGNAIYDTGKDEQSEVQ